MALTKDDIRNWVVYKITNPSGRIYIGKTVDFAKRMSSYKSNNCKEQRYIYHSLIKYGFEAHNIEIIDKFTSNLDYASGKEIFWIRSYMSNFSKYGMGMNLTDGGDGTLGYIPTKETRKKMSEAAKGRIPHNKGKKCSPEQMKALQEGAARYREKYGAWAKGIRKTGEQKRKISESKKGSTYNRGRVHKGKARENILKNLAISHALARKPILLYDLNQNFLAEYDSIKSCAKAIGKSASVVGQYLSGKTKSSKYILKNKK